MSKFIENSDRGITLNKSLAWTVAVGLLTGGGWVGIQVTTATNGMQTLAARQVEDRAEIRANSQRISEIRSQSDRADERLQSIDRRLQALDPRLLRIEQAMNEISRYLRTNENR